MKTIKGLAIFIFFSILFGSCFNPPEFSIVPSISYDHIEFKPGQTLGEADSLNLFINFEDGDGDLGLGDTQTDFPFHPDNFYLENLGDTLAISTSYDQDIADLLHNPNAPEYVLPDFLNVPAGAVGKLLTLRNRDNPLYDWLPPYECPYAATAYQVDSVYIRKSDERIIDDTYNIYRVIKRGSDTIVLVVLETFYYQPNPNHNNIDIEIWIRNSNNTFTLFDWKSEYCVAQDFSQRFPILSFKENPLAGILKYSIRSSGLRATFSGKYIKLKVRIRDRALHVSRTIETDVFLLEDKIK